MKTLAVGTPVRVTTATGAVCEGRVFCYEAESEILVLEEGDERDRGHHDIRMISGAGVKKVEVLGEAPANLDVALPNISTKSVLEKEKRASAREEEAVNARLRCCGVACGKELADAVLGVVGV